MIKKILVGLLTATVVFASGEARFPKGIIGDLQGSATTITGTLSPSNVPNNFITNAQLQNMPAHTIKGNNTGSSGSPQDLTATQATAELNPFVGDTGFGGTKGLVPAPAIGDATKCLGGNGLWTTCGGGGGGGSGTASKYEQLEQKNQLEHYNLITDPLDQSLGTGFAQAPGSYYIQGVLMDSVVAGSGTIVPVYNPIALVPSDVNLDSTTNWAPLVGTSSVTTDAVHKVGNLSLKFVENSGQPRASIFYDHGSETLSVNGFSDHYLWVNLSSVTGVNAVRLEIGDIGGTSSICVSCTQVYDITTQANGSPLQVGWNLIHKDLRQGGVAVGGGWPTTRPFRYYSAGVYTPGGTATPTVLIDGIYSSIDDATRYIPKGAEMTIYDATHREKTVLDAANNAVTGSLSALNNFTYSYTPGIGGATVARSTLAIGEGKASMATTDQFGNAVSGDAQLKQESRISKVFRSALSAVDLHASFDVYTSQIYRIGATTGSSIYIDDPSDSRLDLKSGETIHIFGPNYADGTPYFSKRCDVTMTADATPIVLGSTTGLVAVPCAGAQAGDYAAKKHLTASFQVGAIGANETFAAPFSLPSNPDDVILYDDGLPIPYPKDVYGIWSLNGPRGTKNLYGPAPDLTTVGSPTLNSSFKNGQFSGSNFNASNYFRANGTASFISSPGVFTVSIWHYADTSSVSSFFIGTEQSTTLGWGIQQNGSNQYCINNFGSAIVCGGAVRLNKFNHIVFVHDAGNTAYLYVNNVLVGSTPFTIGSSSQDLKVGAGGTVSGDSVYSPGERVAQAAIWLRAFTADDVAMLFNSDQARVIGFGPTLKYRFNALGASGQSCTLKGELQRDTINVVPSIEKMGISP